jgi:hypothetical protein
MMFSTCGFMSLHYEGPNLFDLSSCRRGSTEVSKMNGLNNLGAKGSGSKYKMVQKYFFLYYHDMVVQTIYN